MTSVRTIPMLLAVAVCLAPFAASAAGTPEQACRAAKLKAAGKYASALAGCESKAVAGATTPEAECLSKAAAKIADAFVKADAKGEPSCSGLESSTVEDVQALVADVLAAAPSAPGGGKCPASIYKAGGKYASSLLSAWSKFVTSADALKRDASITKGSDKLVSSIAKAEENEGCSGTGQAAAVELAVESGAEPILACIAGTGSCAEEVVGGGETVTTDPDGNGPDAEEPIAASVQTPVAGTVTLHVVEGGMPPSGYEVLGQTVEVEAPDASAASPLVLTFTLDASVLPPDPMTVTLSRDGVVIADCTGAPGVADPDPCLDSRTIVAGGDLEIVALSSHASTWAVLRVAAPPTTLTTTTTLVEPPADYWMQWQVRADKVGADVETEIDIGWGGPTHDIDPADGSSIRFGLSCPSASLPGSYGECTVTGFDPTPGNCRCANNTATVCDEPSALDADDCGGASCTCYTRPPMSGSAYGTPFCMVGVTSADASGTWNPDTGSGDVQLDEVFKIHLGISVAQPCPACVGDTTANDGVKGGTCNGGHTPGAACDANGTDPTFPAPGGGSTSLDCLPSAASNVSGPGMKFSHLETTSSASLASNLPCVGNPSENCPCALCSTNTAIACASDADCQAQAPDGCSLAMSEPCTTNSDCTSADVGPCLGGILRCSGLTSKTCSSNADCTNQNVGTCLDSTCSSKGGGTNPDPNSCLSACNVSGDGEGLCDGPDNFYCDGLVEEDGRGTAACLTNSDCAGHVPPAGDCTIVQQNDCFAPTIVATGVADPDSPRTVATLCVAPTSNSSINTVSGLPGPARVRTDWTVTYGQ